MDIKGIELSIQSLEYSFNFNLFIVGISNIFGFASASKDPEMQYTSIVWRRSRREA
jgi:hypothetical protein